MGLVRDTATLMVAQYFKRKREIVEIVVVSASGLGITTMSCILSSSVRGRLGWRYGLQVCILLANKTMMN